MSDKKRHRMSDDKWQDTVWEMPGYAVLRDGMGSATLGIMTATKQTARDAMHRKTTLLAAYRKLNKTAQAYAAVAGEDKWTVREAQDKLSSAALAYAAALADFQCDEEHATTSKTIRRMF